jgi:adenylate kinase
MVADRLTHPDAKSGFLLDGYPRNIGQADFLKANLEASGTPLDAVLEFKLENEEIIKRLSGRRACKGCGATSHVIFEAPKIAGVCDSCGGELYQRPDDAENVIGNRLAVYAEQTEPIINYYKSAGLLKTISAVGEVSDIAARAIAALK